MVWTCYVIPLFKGEKSTGFTWPKNDNIRYLFISISREYNPKFNALSCDISEQINRFTASEGFLTTDKVVYFNRGRNVNSSREEFTQVEVSALSEIFKYINTSISSVALNNVDIDDRDEEEIVEARP